MRRLPLLLLTLILKIASTWFALNVFVKLTTVSDPFTYVETTTYQDFLTNRTHLIGFIASTIGQYTNTTLPHYFFSIINGIAIWILLCQIPPRAIWCFPPLVFLPSIAAWSSLVSKESLAISALCLILAAWIRILECKGKSLVTLMYGAIGFLFYGFLRPHFALGAFLLVISSIILRPNASVYGRKAILNPSFHRLGTPTVIFTGLCAFLLFRKYFFDGVDKVIGQSLVYFTIGLGDSSRNSWLPWNDVTSFYTNAWWAVPFGVIGPLPSEVLEKNIFAPAFLEGIFIFSLPFVACFTLVFRIKKNPESNLLYFYRLFFLVLPVVTAFLYFIHAPLGMMNPGSAIRYRTGFEYLVTITWVYIALRIDSIHRRCDGHSHGDTV